MKIIGLLLIAKLLKQLSVTIIHYIMTLQKLSLFVLFFLYLQCQTPASELIKHASKRAVFTVNCNAPLKLNIPATQPGHNSHSSLICCWCFSLTHTQSLTVNNIKRSQKAEQSVRGSVMKTETQNRMPSLSRCSLAANHLKVARRLHFLAVFA